MSASEETLKPSRPPVHGHSPGPGIYVHIPFCLSKCPYCSFNSTPVPDRESVSRYLRALAEEIMRLDFAGAKVSTLYFGGGTPSILDEKGLEMLFAALRSSLTLDVRAEVTLEVNPGTVTPAKARQLADLGVNRVSLGVQSFDDTFLHTLARGHVGAASVESFHILRDEGFVNIGIDLMYGLPGQSVEACSRDIAEALKLRPEHLSFYELTIEERTPFGKSAAAGELDLPAEEETLEMYALIQRSLQEGGYEHYEISNFALPGRRSQHNCNCWNMKDYYGVGAGAHSFAGGDHPRRWNNVESAADYAEALEKGLSPAGHSEALSERTLAGEAVMLGLRLLDGIDREKFARRYGCDPRELFPDAFGKGLQQSWLEEQSGRYTFTPGGILFSNEVFRLLFSP